MAKTDWKFTFVGGFIARSSTMTVLHLTPSGVLVLGQRWPCDGERRSKIGLASPASDS